MKRLIYLLIYMIGFPALGILFGFVFFKIFDSINGPLQEFAFWISIIAWGGFGFIAGCYGMYFFIKVEKLRKLKLNTSGLERHKK